MKGIIWFREDLRLYDNKALYFASRQCSKGVIGVYIIDHSFWKKHQTAHCRIEFILRALGSLSSNLNHLNIPLFIFETHQTTSISSWLIGLAQQHQVEAIFYNRQYEIDEKRRDAQVELALQDQKISCYSYDDQVILPPGSVTTQQNSFFKVFTPYQRAWRKVFTEQSIHLLPSPDLQKPMSIQSTPAPAVKRYHSNVAPQRWLASEEFASQRLEKFIIDDLYSYREKRDFPALDGVSQLSPYLTSGLISPRLCFLKALAANHQQLESGSPGAVCWMSELIWRDFYKHLLQAVPRISMNQPFILATEKLPWQNNQKLFNAWAHGETGFPIIDAAMRQLNTTGWMHNRLRMITASFLARNLQIDWRLGENYFMNHLIDGDLAANNGGWQWCAASGADIMPYFRVFNPVRQSERFDPQGDFIRKFCPELGSLSNKEIHDPTQRCFEKLAALSYPQAIINLEESRRQFVAAYRKKVLNMAP